MRDVVATFYGGYDLEDRARTVRTRVSPYVLLIVVACLVLIGFIAADVTAFQSLPGKVDVTSVQWFAGTELLATENGFGMHTSQSVTLSLTCDSLCYAFAGASVSAPFHLTGYTEVDSPTQFVNVTVTAPSAPYNGPLAITLH